MFYLLTLSKSKSRLSKCLRYSLLLILIKIKTCLSVVKFVFILKDKKVIYVDTTVFF